VANVPNEAPAPEAPASAPPAPLARIAERRNLGTPEAVVYVAAIVAATVVACRQPQHALWCLGLIAVLAGVKIADLLAVKAGRPSGAGSVTTLAVAAFAALSLLAGCLS